MTDLARPEDGGGLSTPGGPEPIAPGDPAALPEHLPAGPPPDTEGMFKQIVLLGFRMNWYFLRLATTRRVRIGWKFRIFLGFVYLISPIDLIPEMLLGPIGLLDDAFLAAILPDRMLNGPSEETFAHCWWGGRRAIDGVRRFASAVARAVPGLARRPMAAFLGSPDGGAGAAALPVVAAEADAAGDGRGVSSDL